MTSSAVQDRLSARQALDAIRLRVGLARPQWVRLLGVRSEAEAFESDGSTRPEVEARARQIDALYTEFIASIDARIDAEVEKAQFVSGENRYMSMLQVARLLDLSDFGVSNMKRRGKISSHEYGSRTVFSAEDVRDLLYRPLDGYQSPLCGPFVRFVEQRDADADTSV